MVKLSNSQTPAGCDTGYSRGKFASGVYLFRVDFGVHLTEPERVYAGALPAYIIVGTP